MKSPITTHVLDTGLGRPAVHVRVMLESQDQLGEWKELTRGETDEDGRVTNLLPENVKLMLGVYRLTFDTVRYFNGQNLQTFYPSVSIAFEIHDPTAHYHVPLLLSPYGYTTYRGS